MTGVTIGAHPNQMHGSQLHVVQLNRLHALWQQRRQSLKPKLKPKASSGPDDDWDW